MTYSSNYLDVFHTQRVQLDDELTNYYDFMSMCKTINHHHSCNYISIVANALTAYNELSGLDFFVTMKFFK